MIENEISHADKHILLDVGIKLPIHFLENIGRRRIPYRLTAQNTPADGHDERRGDALTGNIGDGDAQTFVVHFDVIKIIAANLARRHVHATNLKSVYDRGFGRKKNPLDVARDRQVVIESLLFVRLRINNRIVKRECRLLGDRFEDDKIVLRERGTHSAVEIGRASCRERVQITVITESLTKTMV